MTTHRISIFDVQKEKLGVSLFYSFITHCLLLGSFFYLPHYINPKPVMWGDSSAGGGAISVGIVQKVGGLNLPRPELSTENNVATESKGVGQTEIPGGLRQRWEIPDPQDLEIQEVKQEDV